MSDGYILLVKLALFIISILWSLRLGWKILEQQGLRPVNRALPMLFGLAGSVFVGLCWWPALFGV